MSKINDLIKELCPNGVQFINLGNFCEIKTGLGITKKSIVEDGAYEIISGGFEPMGRCNECNRKGNTVTIARAGSAGHVKYIENDFYLNDKCFSIIPKKPIVISKFLYYSLANIQNEIYKLKSSGTVPTVNTEKISKIKVPIPPLEIQKEIVKILDKFDELKAELEAELEARKNQYDFFKKKLYMNMCDTRYVPIEKVCDFLVGGDVPKDRLSKEKTTEYNVPIISNGIGENAIYGYTDEAKISRPSITISARGTIGYSQVRSTPYFPIVRLICVFPNKKINIKFLKYYFDTIKFKVPTTGIPQLTVPMVKKLTIPVPPLEIQNKIVKILDKFDKLINDISVGLPAEIELRRKQYEYYRNKLLSFEELSAND